MLLWTVMILQRLFGKKKDFRVKVEKKNTLFYQELEIKYSET